MIYQIINYIIFGLSCLSFILSMIITFFNGKYKKFSELMAKLPEFCEEAEKMFEGEGKGKFKHDYVMTCMRNSALMLHYSISDDDISNSINDFIKSTKNINVKSGVKLDTPFHEDTTESESVPEVDDNDSEVVEPIEIREV